jgi:aminoglycoside/choline kinase family phosphotransferase
MTTNRVFKIVKEIETGGSDRKFYRLINNGKTSILIRGKSMAEYRAIQEHLARCKTTVPKLYCSYRDMAIVEDLGDNSLFELTVKKCGINQILYRRVLKELVNLQVNCTRNAPLKRYYDIDHIRWEQDYFREFFLEQYCGLTQKKLRGFEEERARLTDELILHMQPFNHYFMHRDFQSQNIIFKDGKPRFIDFQSARFGPLTYDLASLLRDAYVHIPQRIENTLLRYYLNRLIIKGVDIDTDRFIKTYYLTGIQRNMQALGAFANLSLNKNKTRFLDFIPRGLTLLKSGLRREGFPKTLQILKEIENVR